METWLATKETEEIDQGARQGQPEWRGNLLPVIWDQRRGAADVFRLTQKLYKRTTGTEGQRGTVPGYLSSLLNRTSVAPILS